MLKKEAYSYEDVFKYLINHRCISLRKVVTTYGLDVKHLHKLVHSKGFDLMVETEFSVKLGEYSILTLKRSVDKIYDERGDRLFPCRVPMKLFETVKDLYICHHGHQCYHGIQENCVAGENGIKWRKRGILNVVS